MIMAHWWNVWYSVTLLAWCGRHEGAARLVHYKDCGTATKLLKVDVSPCFEEPCQFKHNTSATITVWFDAVENSNELSVKIYGIVDNIKIPFPLPNPDGCKNCGIKCPVTAATSYVYENTMKIQPSYPSLKIVNEWNMYGDGGKMMFCFAFPLIIEPGTNSRDRNDIKPAEFRMKPRIRNHGNTL